MLFDNFDKKIKEAAEQHHPAYDENAWRKMEGLLNEHLPKKRDKRRFFLLAFTTLLIGGGVFVLLSKPHAKNSDQTVQESKSSTIGQTQTDKTGENTGVAQPGVDNTNREINDNTVTGAITKIVDKRSRGPVSINQNPVAADMSKPRINKDQVPMDNAVSEQDKNVAANGFEEKNASAQQTPISPLPHDKIAKNENPVIAPIAKENNVANSTQPVKGNSAKTTAKNGRPGTMNGLSFFVAGGPDVSKAQNSKTGKVTMSWGLGLAYTLNRITLRTGVFSASKKYWAGPADYKLGYTPPASLKFKGADADCKVIEIPVKVSYNFAVKDKSNWFAGAGLSSYLMKRENYLYEYESNSGGSYYHSYETRNENKHYFSVLNLSAGYSYRLNNTISLSAEPYVEVPLTGIGAGKVHLNSAGVLFTIGVRPFRK